MQRFWKCRLSTEYSQMSCSIFRHSAPREKSLHGKAICNISAHFIFLIVTNSYGTDLTMRQYYGGRWRCFYRYGDTATVNWLRSLFAAAVLPGSGLCQQQPGTNVVQITLYRLQFHEPMALAQDQRIVIDINDFVLPVLVKPR